MNDEFKRFIEEHICRCEVVLTDKNYREAQELQESIINAFAQFIPEIDSSLDYIMVYPSSRQVDYIGNIRKLRDKLRVLLMTDGKYSINSNKSGSDSKVIFQNNNVLKDSGNSTNTNTNTITNTFDIKVELDKVRAEIESDEVLDDDVKEEINTRLDEIEEVMNNSSSNNEKWKKLKSTFTWIAGKSYKVGKWVMPIITKALFPEE